MKKLIYILFLVPFALSSQILTQMSASGIGNNTSKTEIKEVTNRWVLAQYDNLAVSVDTTHVFVSKDNSRTFPDSLAFNKADKVNRAYIYKNGNIILTTIENEIYFTTYKLRSIDKKTVYEADGVTPYLFHAPINLDYSGRYFDTSTPMAKTPETDLHVFGNYTNVEYGASAVNIYYTADFGKTIKIAFKFGQNRVYDDNGTGTGGVGNAVGDASQSLVCRHVHAIEYSAKTDTWYAFTGDNHWAYNDTREVHILKGKYNSTLDNWSWTEVDFGFVIQQQSHLKIVDAFFYDGYMYYTADATNVTNGNSNGFWRVKEEYLNNINKHFRLFTTPNYDDIMLEARVDKTTGYVVGCFAEVHPASVEYLFIAKDYGHGEMQYKKFEGNNFLNGFSANNEGYFKFDTKFFDTLQTKTYFVKGGFNLFDKITLPVKAFPTAEGFGKNATGGRGGTVIKVTNLNDSGAGSLREACNTVGAKTIVFEVGGTITLSSNLDINANTTIAGQTAPGDGILLAGGKILIPESNVIIRYLRVRPDGVGDDGVAITAIDGTIIEDVIIDHCSLSWASDENIGISVTGGSGSTAIVRDITIQNCLIGEATYAFLNGGGRTYNLTVYNNLFALNQDRHIRSQGSVYIGNTAFDYEMINNVIYGFSGVSNMTYGHKMSAINNHWKPSSEVSHLEFDLYKTQPEFGGVLADTDAYITGNTVPSGHGEYETELDPYITGTPYGSSGIIPIAASSVPTAILSTVGCSYPTRDAVDTRLVQHYNDGDGSLSETRTFPTINNGTPPTDADNDGMADSWETATFGNLSRDGTGDFDSDGYTDLEEYINSLIGE